MLALSFLATEGAGRIIGPREIARRYEIPAELLAKVMQSLSKRQIVVSVPGPTGGYKLVRSADSISIGEIVEAVDGPLAIAQCWEEAGMDGCQQSRHCHLRGPLARIQEEINFLLRRMTLADVCPPDEQMPEIPERTFAPGRTLTVWESADSDAASTAAGAGVTATLKN
jgi:Rrf2 family protein